MALSQSNAIPVDAQSLDGNFSFPDAADAWLGAKKQEVGLGTFRLYGASLRQLKAFFGQLPIRDIHVGHITEYRRHQGRIFSAGPSRINHEISTLSQIMDRAGCWAHIAKHYKPMRKPRGGPGQRVPIEELKHLLAVAQRKPRWQIAYLCSIVSANTAAGPGEILSLRLKDINFNAKPEPLVTFIEGTKCDRARVRSIPMTPDCQWAMRGLVKIARSKGAVAPEHHLLPHRAHEKGAAPDPTQRMGSYRKAWESLRKEASKKFAALAHVRRYDLRHTAITMMAEDPNVDAPTLRKISGWGPGSKMLEDHYFHHAIERQKIALRGLNGLVGNPPPAISTPATPPERGVSATASVSQSPNLGSTWTSTNFGKSIL